MATNHRAPVKSLSEQVRWQLMWLGVGLFLACILLLFVFTWRSVELTTTSLMQLEAESLVRVAAENPGLPLPQGETFGAYRTWEEIPEYLRRHFENMPLRSGKIFEVSLSGIDGEPEHLYLLHHIDENYGELFLLSRHSATEIDAISASLVNSALSQALWISLIIFVALFFLARWLIRRTTEPLALLSQWAGNLSKNPDQPLKVDFPIEELNRLAAQLREGVDQLEIFNRREQEFLKHASHELRTPLAIIQASLDTLNLQSGNKDRPAVRRALRASANMNRLSTALLWLARDSERPIDKERVEAEKLCHQMIDDQRYLLGDRDIRVSVNAVTEIREIECEMFSIVLINLIRNAFQHSTNGTINVNILAGKLRISNPANDETVATIDHMASGFGLGLQLVRRICQKLGWQFSFEKISNTVIVTITWSTD